MNFVPERNLIPYIEVRAASQFLFNHLEECGSGEALISERRLQRVTHPSVDSVFLSLHRSRAYASLPFQSGTLYWFDLPCIWIWLCAPEASQSISHHVKLIVERHRTWINISKITPAPFWSDTTRDRLDKLRKKRRPMISCRHKRANTAKILTMSPSGPIEWKTAQSCNLKPSESSFTWRNKFNEF